MTDQPTMRQRMDSARAFIAETAPHDPHLRLSDMAEAAGMDSAFRFHREFSRAHGETPSRFAARCRAEARQQQAA